jgi:hypothetical protein
MFLLQLDSLQVVLLAAAASGGCRALRLLVVLCATAAALPDASVAAVAALPPLLPPPPPPAPLLHPPLLLPTPPLLLQYLQDKAPVAICGLQACCAGAIGCSLLYGVKDIGWLLVQGAQGAHRQPQPHPPY